MDAEDDSLSEEDKRFFWDGVMDKVSETCRCSWRDVGGMNFIHCLNIYNYSIYKMEKFKKEYKKINGEQKPKEDVDGDSW